MRIINLVDSIAPINYGIWNAAVSTSDFLQQNGVASELWYPEKLEPVQVAESYKLYGIRDLSKQGIRSILIDRNLDNNKDLIVSHGCWKQPSRLGYRLRKMGFKWIHTPHGMLEPWALSQKQLKKKLYFNLVERRYLSAANLIRAVSSPEQTNLGKLFPQSTIIKVYNGVAEKHSLVLQRTRGARNFLFMARLHEKKGIIPLIEAWTKSNLNRSKNYNLFIAGPDHGELSKILALIVANEPDNNIYYVGNLNENQKYEVFRKSHFFILPSYSEGFSTSVIEAMQHGLVPMVSHGCNFPEVFSEGIAFLAEPNETQLVMSLHECAGKADEYLDMLREKAVKWVNSNCLTTILGQQQLDIYKQLLHIS